MLEISYLLFTHNHILLFFFSALRTPVTRARRGGLKDVHAEMMLATVLKGVLAKTGIDPKLIEDVVVGNVLPPGGGATVARMAALYAGIPESSAVMTVNRQCSSGLQAVAQVASAIKSGYIDIGIGKLSSVQCNVFKRSNTLYLISYRRRC